MKLLRILQARVGKFIYLLNHPQQRNNANNEGASVVIHAVL